MEIVEYFELPQLPGKPMFVCQKRRATLSAQACADLWSCGAKKNSDDRFLLCRGCSIGAKHAGVGDATLSPLYASSTCARCGCGSTRLIHGHLCVSCYNRAREWIKGCNARGNAPVTHPTLYRLALKYKAGGRVKVVEKPYSANSTELVFAVLRDEPKQATFCALLQRSPLPQRDLFS